MADIFETVKDMNRSQKIAYLKNLSPDDRHKYDNFMNYQRILRLRNKNRQIYNDYMKNINKKTRENNYEKYRINNNRDVANHYAKKKYTPDIAAKIISDNIKKYLEKINALKQSNRDKVLNKSNAISMANNMVNSLFDKNKNINFNDLNVRQMKKIIMYNKNSDGTSIIFDYNKMSKSQLLSEMNKIKDKLSIPSDL